MGVKKTPLTRELEPDEVRKKIVEAASRLFEKKGLYETSVAEVAEAAGISAPLAFKFLSGKSDLILLIMEDFYDQFRRQVQPLIAEPADVREKLVRAIKVFFHMIAENADKAILVYRESRALNHEGRVRIKAAEIKELELFKGILQEGLDQGVFTVTDLDVAAYNIILAGHAWVLKGWYFRKLYDLDEYLRRQTEIILKAISV